MTTTGMTTTPVTTMMETTMTRRSTVVPMIANTAVQVPAAQLGARIIPGVVIRRGVGTTTGAGISEAVTGRIR